MNPATFNCPHCGRRLAVTPGANQAHCFGCQRIVSLTSSAPANSPSSTGKGGVGIGIIVGAVAGFVVLLTGVIVAFFVLMPTSDIRSTPAPSTDVASVEQPSPSPTPTQTSEPEIVATEEEQRLAASVPAPVRAQIVEMWEKLTSSTDKKILAPKGSTLRQSTENLLGNIEDREIRNMAALLQVDEDKIRAVIRVYQAGMGTE